MPIWNIRLLETIEEMSAVEDAPARSLARQ